MYADYTAWASAVAAFSAVACWTNHLFIDIMANAIKYRLQKRRFIASNFLALTDMAPIYR